MATLAISVAATREALPELLDWLWAACAELGIDESMRGRITIVLEELFLNTVDHGFGGKPGPAILYHLALAGGGVIELGQQDKAPPFDLSTADTPTAALERIGGLGITMIHGMSKAIEYRRECGTNITTIKL